MKRTLKQAAARRVLILVDESNITSSAKATNRKLDWLKLRDHLVQDGELIEMVVYAGLPPAMAEWQAERDKLVSERERALAEVGTLRRDLVQ